MMNVCPGCHGEHFICEQHPDSEWPHDECAGPGVPWPVCNTAESPVLRFGVDAEQWQCPRCGSGVEAHRVEKDGPESLEVMVCQRCGAQRAPPPSSRVTPPT